MAGQSGTGKSELSALAQAHFGAGFTRLTLPAQWLSTANALERLAFEAKDCLVVIDDFAPRGSPLDVTRLHAAADRVFRAAGNHAGRSRMAADGSLRPDYPPRGFLLSSGEDVPSGRGLAAGLRGVEGAPGGVRGPPARARLNAGGRPAAGVAEDPAIARRPAVLHAAGDFSRHALVEWRFLRGADPNVRDAGEAKRTPLHSAAWNGDLRMVKRLLMHGADPRLRDRQYDGTPAGWASTASEITNNPRCRDVAAYLGGLAHGPQSREG